MCAVMQVYPDHSCTMIYTLTFITRYFTIITILTVKGLVRDTRCLKKSSETNESYIVHFS